MIGQVGIVLFTLVYIWEKILPVPFANTAPPSWGKQNKLSYQLNQHGVKKSNFVKQVIDL